MYFIEFLGQMMSLYHSLTGLDNGQSFEPGQPGSMENLKNMYNFPAISSYIPSFNMIKTMFIEKYNLATWVNVHRFLLNSTKSFNRYEFFMALQCILLVYFPGMALGIVYQYYELDQQTQELMQKQDQNEEDIYQILLQEMQEQPQQQSRSYIKQQLELEEQCSLQSMSQSSRMMQFVQLIQRFIEQIIQTPQSMLYQIQYEQDCRYINQTINQQMQQQNSQYHYQYYQYHQYDKSQNRRDQEMQSEEVNRQDMMMKQCQFIIVTMKQPLTVYQSTTTNSTLNNNENGGVNMIIMVIKIKLPGEGHQIVQF